MHVPSKQYYIGGTENLYHRMSNHKTKMKKGRHHALWNGLPAAEFTVAYAAVPEPKVSEVEQEMLDRYFGSVGCINTVKVARYPSPAARESRRSYFNRNSRRRKHALYCSGGRVYTVKSHRGRIYRVANLNGFCQRHGLDQPSLWRVVNGLSAHHHGYMLVKSEAVKVAA